MQFNDKRETVAQRTETTNLAGGKAFSPDSPEVALYKNVINNLLESSYYESDDEKFTSVVEAFEDVAETNPEFVLKMAKYARQEENLRQVPQLLLVLAANDERTQPFVRDYATSIMSRADEPLDVLALHVSRNGTSIPNCLQKSIEDAMHQWNEWQYAKWERDSREWRYRDLMNLVHPKPRDDERAAIFEKIVRGGLDAYPDVEELKQSDTWESSLSADDGRSKADKYREQLTEGNMGIFPRIRQARDMLESGVTAQEIYGDVDDEWIRNSRLFPFRFYQGYKAVQQSNEISVGEQTQALTFLEHFMEVSTENLPDVLEDTFVAVDISGSMSSRVSSHSELQCVEIGALFGSLLYKRGADVAAFATDVTEFHEDRRNPVTTNADRIRRLDVGGHSTNGYLVPRALREYNRGSYKQVIVFTDMQLWDSNSWRSESTLKEEWDQYVRETNPEASLYLVDLASYGTLQTPETQHDVYNISGWSEKVIDFIDAMENIDGMVRAIEAVKPDR